MSSIYPHPFPFLQFWPKNNHAQAKVHYTSRFKVKYMVQARQFRKDHEDMHYAAVIFRYQRKFRHHSIFMCMDDKHRREPNYPVAAAERGRRVLVAKNESFEVGDHDFTKFSVIPSVGLRIDDITESWYSGKVYVGLKEGAFEPSSPHRRMCDIMKTTSLFSSFTVMEVQIID